MKKTRLLIAILFLVSINSNVDGQEQIFQPGLILNFNGIHLEGEKNNYWGTNNGTKWGTGGISFGAFVSCNLDKNKQGRLELRYIRKGGLFEFLNTDGSQAYENLILKYIEIPVLFAYTAKAKKRSFILEAGLSYATLLSKELHFYDNYQRINTPNTNNFKDNDISWVIDIKCYNNKHKSFLVGFRFAHSLFSIHKTYKLYNMDYGIEFNYLLFNNK